VVLEQRTLYHSLLTSCCILPFRAQAKTKVVWWHAHTGNIGERLNDIVKKFNSSQPDYEVEAVHKGGYRRQ